MPNKIKFNLNKRQIDLLYPKMQIMYVEVCASCQRTLEQCNMKKFNIHHTRYDIEKLDPYWCRFFCNSCNKLKEFSYEKIVEGQNKFKINKREQKDSDPVTFLKSEQIAENLKEYLDLRMEQVRHKNRRLDWIEFRNDASTYCECMPKTITEHIVRLVSKEYGRFYFYSSPADHRKYICFREDKQEDVSEENE
jgi:hypothetical protein